MITKKMAKNGDKWTCIPCAFKTQYKSNYDNHLLTAKHKMIINGNKKMAKNGKAYLCVCGKKYKHASGLSRHKMHCKNHDKSTTNDIIIHNTDSYDYKGLLLQSMEQNNELMNLIATQHQEHKEETKELLDQNKKMQRTIQDIVPKIGSNNTVNNNYNLNVFLNEDCKDALNFSEFIDTMKISFEDLENQSQIGYIKGISKLFIENLQELGTHKRPIHCTDKKRNTLYIKENDEWEKEGSQESLKKGIQEVTRRTQEELIKKKEENREDYDNADSEFSEKCISIQHNLIPDAPRETTINKVIKNISKTTEL